MVFNCIFQNYLKIDDSHELYMNLLRSANLPIYPLNFFPWLTRFSGTPVSSTNKLTVRI
jgi:hypothetical protein